MVKGKTQPEDNILSSLIIVAPSCNGVLTTKIFSSKLDVTLASKMVPVFDISPSLVSCSTTIKAPVLLSDKFSTALTISLTVIFLVSSSYIL